MTPWRPRVYLPAATSADWESSSCCLATPARPQTVHLLQRIADEILVRCSSAMARVDIHNSPQFITKSITEHYLILNSASYLEVKYNLNSSDEDWKCEGSERLAVKRPCDSGGRGEWAVIWGQRVICQCVKTGAYIYIYTYDPSLGRLLCSHWGLK